MTVNEMINLISTLSVGLDAPSADDQEIFLRYLNLAHYELYRKTAHTNPAVGLVREVLDVVDGDAEDTSSPFFMVRSVYRTDQNMEITPSSLDDVQAEDPQHTKVGSPRLWYYANNKISVYPIYTGEIGILYVKAPTPFTLNTSQAEIPYPPIFHSVLVHGASYYLFQGETGFRNETKMKDNELKWMNESTQLLQYLTNISGKKYYSTFSYA